MAPGSASQDRPFLAATDRAELCDLFDEVGPDAPTLCEGWTTEDLAAHLVARERRPDSVPGLVVPLFEGWSERVRRGERRRPYPDLVETIRSGPPIWWLGGIVPAADRWSNTHEFFVHHEDVRRAREDWEPRDLDPEAESDLWRVLGWFARRSLRPAPVGVLLRRPDGETIIGRKAGAVDAMVEVVGRPGELLLFAFGRRAHARVEFEGPPVAVDTLRDTDLSW